MMSSPFRVSPLTFIMASLLCVGIMASTACSPAQQDSAGQAQLVENEESESKRLATFFEDSFEQGLRRSPMMQSQLGLKWDYDKWNDISQAFADESKTIRQQAYAKAKDFDQSKLSDAEVLSLQLFIADLERKAANDEFTHHSYIMHQFRGWHTVVPSFLINTHRVSDESDAQAYVSRLEKVAPLFDQVIEQLRIRESEGIFPPKWSYEQMIEASANVLKGQPFTQQGDMSTILADLSKK